MKYSGPLEFFSHESGWCDYFNEQNAKKRHRTLRHKPYKGLTTELAFATVEPRCHVVRGSAAPGGRPDHVALADFHQQPARH